MIVAAIILVSKLVSSVLDPVFGNLIDKSHFKSGKMKPFILMSGLPFAIITTIMFVYIPFKSMAGMYVYITFLSIIWNVSMSLADISSQGMLALLSPRADERNMAAGITNTLKSIGIAANGVIVPIICLITGSGQDRKNRVSDRRDRNERRRYRAFQPHIFLQQGSGAHHARGRDLQGAVPRA